jgi:hypothetical protein
MIGIHCGTLSWAMLVGYTGSLKTHRGCDVLISCLAEQRRCKTNAGENAELTYSASYYHSQYQTTISQKTTA